MQRLLTILAVFGLVSATTLSAQATPRPKTRTEYVVTEYNPLTRGKVSTNRFSDKSQANRQYDMSSKVHWVKWRFVGINEPLRSRRFKSSFEAQDFINDGGPAKSGKFGIAILTDETRIVASRVTMTSVTVPVDGGGNGGGGGGGGGNGGNGEVIDVIDRIIGIIGR